MIPIMRREATATATATENRRLKDHGLIGLHLSFKSKLTLNHLYLAKLLLSIILFSQELIILKIFSKHSKMNEGLFLCQICN